MTTSKKMWYAWAASSFVAFGVIETAAMLDKHPDTTLSATWWRLRTKLPVRLLVFPPLTWTIYHLFIPWDKKTGGMDDAAVLVGGVAIALAARYEDRNGR